MSSLLIAVTKNSDLRILLKIVEQTGTEGFLSNLAPRSVQIPSEQILAVTPILEEMGISCTVKAIGGGNVITPPPTPSSAPPSIEKKLLLEDLEDLEEPEEISRSLLKSYSAFGKRKTPTEWSQDPRCLVSLATLRSRLKLGWDIEPALVQPPRAKHTTKATALGETKSLSEWAKDPRCRVPAPCFFSRIKLGWGVEKSLTTPLMRSPPRSITPPCPKCGGRTTVKETSKVNPSRKGRGRSPGIPAIKRRAECVKCHCTFTLYFPINQEQISV